MLNVGLQLFVNTHCKSEEISAGSVFIVLIGMGEEMQRRF